MRPLFAIIGFTLVFSAGLVADDGTWSATYSLSEGSLYSETENKDIALEEEILAFDGFESGLTRAAFFFSNTAGNDLKVQAGFPVRVSLELVQDLIPGTKDKTGLFFNQSKYGPEGEEIGYARLVFGDVLKTAAYPADEYFEHSAEYFLAGDLPPRKEIPAKTVSDRFDFSVSQDDSVVKCDTVVVEAELIGSEGSPQALDITFHFRHVLSFKAGAKSRVDVGYVSEYRSGGSNMGNFMMASYAYSYILGTGRTWKGPIGRLYLAVPFGSDPDLPGAFSRLGKMGQKDVYLAANYEPAPEDGISIGYSNRSGIDPSYLKYLWFEEGKEADASKAPADDFIVVKGASSYLKDTAAVYTVDGVIPKAAFGPLSLFDGVPETAWCEGAKGDGIGEWVEFELKRDVEALEVQNGFNMSFIQIEGKAIDTYYDKNNRPKTVEIVSADGKVKKTLPLADTKEIQSFDGVFLPKGSYKLFIRDVYKGSKWQDTCLGEIYFHPASSLFPQLQADSFLKAHAAEIAGP